MVASLEACRTSIEDGRGHVAKDSTKAIVVAIDPLCGLATPSTDSVAWLFDKYPVLATSMNMAHAMRSLEASTSQLFRDWFCDEMIKDDFLMDGFGDQLAKMDTVVSHARTFKGNANETVLELQSAESLAEFADCRPLAAKLHTPLKSFLTVLADSESVVELVKASAIAKGNKLLDDKEKEVLQWDVDFRKWTGMQDVMQRNNRSIKQHMLGKGEGQHQKITKDLGKFDKVVGNVSKAIGVLPALKGRMENAKATAHDGRLYTAASGIICNAHVRKLQKAPQETIAEACKRIAKGAVGMQLWTTRQDGREILQKDLIWLDHLDLLKSDSYL